MSRGIQLKQLTGADLKLLGLPETAGSLAADPLAIPSQVGLVPRTSTEGTAGGSGAEAPEGLRDGSSGPTGPPRNPALGPAQASKLDSESGWQPLDLRLVTRELCRELEATLGLLGGPAGGTLDPDEAPG